jgi:hypothetical protein
VTVTVAVFWAVAPCSLVEVTDVSVALAAFVIRAITYQSHVPNNSYTLKLRVRFDVLTTHVTGYISIVLKIAVFKTLVAHYDRVVC